MALRYGKLARLVLVALAAGGVPSSPAGGGDAAPPLVASTPAGDPTTLLWYTHPAEKWDEFLAEQKELLARRSPQAKEGRPALTARIRMPDGTIVDNVSGRCALKNEFRSPTSSGSGTQTGGLSRTDLTWGLAEVENGTSTYVLSIAGLVSEPVTVEWRNGTANPDNILFRMRPKR